jgi:hypothetical protein
MSEQRSVSEKQEASPTEYLYSWAALVIRRFCQTHIAVAGATLKRSHMHFVLQILEILGDLFSRLSAPNMSALNFFFWKAVLLM